MRAPSPVTVLRFSTRHAGAPPELRGRLERQRRGKNVRIHASPRDPTLGSLDNHTRYRFSSLSPSFMEAVVLLALREVVFALKSQA